MCNTYAPLHCHSYYSLLDGLPSPKKIAERAKEIGAPAIALTDHGSICGMVEHYNACKALGIKPIIGIELYMCKHDPTIKNRDNNKRYHLTVLAKNKQGIETLMALVSQTNDPTWFYRKPRIDLKHLAQFAKDGNLICLSGCLAGELSTGIFIDEVEIGNKKTTGLNAACFYGDKQEDIDNVRALLLPDWKDKAAQIIAKYQKAFGKDNFYIELQTEGMIAQDVVVECLRQVSKDLNIPSVATLDSHYCSHADYEDQRVLLCSQMHTTLKKQEELKRSGQDTMAFFYLDSFYIFDHPEMLKHYSSEEVETSLEIADKIAHPTLGRKPCLPKFKHFNDNKTIDSNAYLKEICLEGAKIKLTDLPKDKKKEYWDRLKKELRVIKEAKLADYFLIVWDACMFVDKHKGPRGKGRGSGAGSLVNYLTGITGIDPIEYGLYFERFYNISRNIPPHFDFGDISFMDWYSDNFEQLSTRDIKDARSKMAEMIRTNSQIKNPTMLKEEAQWIDDNNPKMWLYIEDQIPNPYSSRPLDNKNNSHIVGAFLPALDSTKPVIKHLGHISLPDIDVDIGIGFRAKVIEYLIERWGQDYVGQMVTFGRLQGKAALKEVFRVRDDEALHLTKVKAVKLGEDPNEIVIDLFTICNDITKFIPDEAAIADELQIIRDSENNPDYGILQWAIHNIEKVGEAYEWYKPLFDQAIRIEGTKKSQSRHAAGIMIADRPIRDLVPLVYDAKNKGTLVGLEMNNAEEMGGVKFDFLGVAALDKLWLAQDLINESASI